jgi:L-iditol 2-dehydrogenase
VEIGEGVEGFGIGDRVTSLTTAITCDACDYCLHDRRQLCVGRRNLGTHVQGAFAEYIVIDYKLVHKIPDNLSFDEASTTEPLACAVHGILETTSVVAGDYVLISGPGTVGLFATQLAKAAGGKVIVCGTAADKGKLKIAKDIGADYTVDVENEDLQKTIQEVTDGEGVHLYVECAGAASSAAQCLSAVRKMGRYHQMGIFSKVISFDLDMMLMKELLVTSSWGNTAYGFKRGLELLGNGQVQAKPLIGAKLPIEDWKKGFEMVENKEAIKVLLYT